MGRVPTPRSQSVAVENGHEKIFSILDALYGEPGDVVLIESLEEALYGTVRKTGEDYLTLMNKMDHRFRKLEENCKSVFPDVAKGYILARQYGLSPQEMREMLLLTGAEISCDKVKNAPRRLLYDFAKKNARNPSNPKIVFEVQHADHDPEQVVVSDDEHDRDVDDALWQIIGNDDSAVIEEDAAIDVLLSYKEARDRIKTKMLNRGCRTDQRQGGHDKNDENFQLQGRFSGKLSIAELKARTKCRKCGKAGHWSRECRSTASSTSTSATKPSTTSSGTTAVNPVSFVQVIMEGIAGRD